MDVITVCAVATALMTALLVYYAAIDRKKK